MNNPKLTSEQMQVVHHPLGMHARVLAVAGSGKSTTLAHRVKYLVMQKHVPPENIRILMFNALARHEFRNRLEKTGLPEEMQPEVHTYHSFSYKVVRAMVNQGVLPELIQFWIGDKEALIALTIKRAISNLEREGKMRPEMVDLELAMSTISRWKGALLPPERAGTTTSPYLPLVYAEYERLRLEKVAMTFDDFIPLALDILSSNPQAHSRWCKSSQHILVDEYQDINFGQQKLIEILAGNHADIMVVGDDDQTIYEWRGARPDYILRDFNRVFNHRSIREYCLSHSFRFGPTIAGAASSVIACNSIRVKKTVVAHTEKHGFIHVMDGGYDSTHALAEEVLSLTQGDGVAATNIAVLARLYAQMDDLEAEFLNRKIPYHVDGHAPFFKRSEVKVLLDYICLARDLNQPLSDKTCNRLMFIANKPFRMLSISVVRAVIHIARAKQLTLHEVFELEHTKHSYLNPLQSERVIQLWLFLENLSQKVLSSSEQAGDVMKWMVTELEYLSSFQDYYGPGEHADEKAQAVLNFVEYVTYTKLSPLALLEHVERLDTTQGAPLPEQITFTTIHRTKGLEFDYVILPHCDENVFPYLKGEHSFIYDTSGKFHEVHLTPPLESERRLFYVALTRARKGVLIGISHKPSRFIAEMRLNTSS
jgi:DNA helicase-2/ATP-dependent DNA helicase PcrA